MDLISFKIVIIRNTMKITVINNITHLSHEHILLANDE